MLAARKLSCTRGRPACAVGVRVNTNTVQYSSSTVQYSTVQYSTVQYSTVQYSTVQYSTAVYPC
jgi:hypothetical protein